MIYRLKKELFERSGAPGNYFLPYIHEKTEINLAEKYEEKDMLILIGESILLDWVVILTRHGIREIHKDDIIEID